MRVAQQQSARRGTAKLISLAALLMTLLVIGGWCFWSRPPTRVDPATGRKVVQTFVDQLQKGEAAAAWIATTSEFKSAQGQEAFVRTVKKLKFLKQPLNYVSTQEVTVGTQKRSEFLFEGSSEARVRVVLAYEAGAWKVDRWTY